MANDTGAGRVTEKGPMTRSAREALSKKVVVSPSMTPNRKSERLGKRTPPTPQVRDKSEIQMKKTKTHSTLRRSERSANSSPSPPSDLSASKTQPKKHNSAKRLELEDSDSSEDEERPTESYRKLKTKKMDARVYRSSFVIPNKDCHGKSNRMNRSAQEGDDGGGDKIDECFKGNHLDLGKDDDGILPPEDAKGEEMRLEPKLSVPVKELLENNVTDGSLVPSNAASHETSGIPERVQSDSCREETSQLSGSIDSKLNENLMRQCVEHDKGEKPISSKRKRTTGYMHPDSSATLVDDGDCNLIEDACLSRVCSNFVGTDGSCSKKIRQISLSDVQRDQRKLTNNVYQPSSKSNDEKLSTRNSEGKSGGRVDSKRPPGSNVETEKIRKQQRRLHILLKPEIAKLCEILHLPDNVKRMVENCLEYTMNNYLICTEPASILQAFQLSLCWTAAALLQHKLDFEASLMLAKQHLNFECKKEVVDEINSKLWDLKENFLSLTRNLDVTGSPKASESSNGFNSNTEVTPEIKLAKEDNSKNIENIQKYKTQWDELLLMQQEERQKLKKDIEDEIAEFHRRYNVEWGSIRTFTPKDVTRKEKLMVFNSEYVKRIGELEKLHEIRLKDLEAKQLQARQKFQESSAPDELLDVVASKEFGTMVESLRTHDQTQHHNAPKTVVPNHVAEGRSFDDIVEVKASTGTGVEISEAPRTNSSVLVPCSSPVELPTPLVKHADANDMYIVVSKDGPVSGNRCYNIAQNECYSQGNIISHHSNSREQCSNGTISMADKGEGCVNFSSESHNDCGQDATTLVLLSSNKEICDWETSDVPSGGVTLAVHKTSSSNDDHVEVPSRQEELGRTIVSKPVCGLSVEADANGSNDGAKIMVPLTSESSEAHIPGVNTMHTPNSEHAAQTQETNENNGSNNAETLNLPFSDEKISSNSKSQQEHVHDLNVTRMPNCENSVPIHEEDGNGSNSVVILNSALTDERNADGTVELNKDVHAEMAETANFTPPFTEISGGADVSVVDSLLSRPCGAASPSYYSDANANAIIPLKQHSLVKQNPEGVSLSTPAGKIPVEVSETSHEVATVDVLDGEEAVGIPSTGNCTDYPENVTPLNYSSMGQISDGGSVLDGALSSKPCASGPSNGCPAAVSLLNPPSLPQQTPDRAFLTLPYEQIPDRVLVPEISHQEAECQSIDSVAMDKSTISDQQGLVLEQIHEETEWQLTDTVVVDKNTTSDQQELVPENSGEEAECRLTDSVVVEKNTTSDQQGLVLENSHKETAYQLTDSMAVDKNTSSDEQGEACRTMTENILSQETPASRPIDLMEPLEQVRPFSSLESPPDQDTVRETHNTLVSSPDGTVPTNQSLHVSPIMEPPELVGQIPSAGFLSSNQDLSNLPLVNGTEDQPTNENDLPNHNSGTSIEIQNQAFMRPDINMDLDSPMPGGVRSEFSDARNLSSLTEINNHPIQTANQSAASRLVSHLCLDPLKIELERLRRLTDQNVKNYENMKLQLKCDFEKELEELYKKFKIKRKEIDVEFQKTRKNLDTQHNIVLVNKILAEAFRAKSMDLRASGASTMQQDASLASQLLLLTSLQNSTLPSLSSSASSCGPPAASLQSSYTSTSSQTMAPPIQATYNTTGTFSNVSARLPHINSISSPSANLQTGGEIRTPAPHLQPFRPSTSIPASNLCTVPHGRPSQPAPSNIPVIPPSFSQRHARPPRPPQPTPATSQSDLRWLHWATAGGLPTPSSSPVNLWADANGQPGLNVPNVPPHMPDLTSLKLSLSRFGTSSSMQANSAHQTTSTDVVCLSDDDD